MSPLRHLSAFTVKPEIFTLLTTSLEVIEQDTGRWLVTLISQQQEEGRKCQAEVSLQENVVSVEANLTRRMLSCKCQAN